MTLFGMEFATVQEAVLYILGIVMDWLSIFILLVLIYMLFKLVVGDKSIGELFGGKGDYPDRESEKEKRRKKKREEEEADEEAKTGKPSKKSKGLDNEHPGRIRILVTNADDNPINDAKVRVYALDMPLWRRALGRHTAEMMVYEDRTGPDGLCPSRVEGKLIGSGPVRVIVKTRFGNADTEALVVPSEGDQVQVIQVVISQKGEREEAFEPHVLSVEEAYPDRLELTGVVR